MKKLLIILLTTAVTTLFAQEGEAVMGTFKDTRVVNGQSVETNPQGQMKFIISHRFGSVKGGLEQLYGLDQATMRLGLDYGIWDNLTVGVGRSTNEKTVDGFAKLNVLKQKSDNSSPLSIALLGSVAVRTLNLDVANREYPFSSKLFYTYQALLARKFSDRFSLQLMPTYVHRNLVSTADVNNGVMAVGAATRYQLTKTISWQMEYYYNFPDQLADIYNNSFSMGFDIDTKSHVFQLHVSNSQGMIEKFFIGETRGDWGEGDFFIGFNISRDFQLGGRKYK